MEELLTALQQAGMTHEQADGVVRAVGLVIDARIMEHFDRDHGATDLGYPAGVPKQAKAKKRKKKRKR